MLGAGMMVWYVWRCTRDHKGFEKAFGPGWREQIHPEQAKKMLKRRWSFYLKMEASPEPSWERDIPFWTIPDTDQQLLCDVWQPADGNVSGLDLVLSNAWRLQLAQGSISNAQVSEWDRWPDLQGLDGNISLANNSGRISLSAPQLKVNWPRMFLI